MWKRPAYRGADCGSARPGGAGQPELDAHTPTTSKRPSAAGRRGRAAATPGNRIVREEYPLGVGVGGARSRRTIFPASYWSFGECDDGGALVGQRTPRIRLVRVAHADYGARCWKSKQAAQPRPLAWCADVGCVATTSAPALVLMASARCCGEPPTSEASNSTQCGGARAIFRRQGCAISLCGSRGTCVRSDTRARNFGVSSSPPTPPLRSPRLPAFALRSVFADATFPLTMIETPVTPSLRRATVRPPSPRSQKLGGGRRPLPAHERGGLSSRTLRRA